MNQEPQKYYGVYKGTVLFNEDPMRLGEINAVVPAVNTLAPSTWVMPCVQMAGKQQGIFCVPQIGAGVWIMFEQGDPDKPVWLGGFWGIAAEVPALALPPAPPPGQNIVIQTTLQNTIMASDMPGPSGGLMLKSTLGAMIVVNDTGIYIQNGKGAGIAMVGPNIVITAAGSINIAGLPVTVNAGALTVT